MNAKKIFAYFCRVGIFFVLLAIVMETQKLANHYERTEFIFPYDSFAHIEVEMDGFSFSAIEDFEVSASGSGIFIGYMSDGRQIILTADHVCNPRTLGVFIPYKEKKINVTDFYGNSFEAEVIKSEYDQDICALAVENSSVTPVSISFNQLSYGEKVYNIAAPMSIFNPGAVPLLDGYFSGFLGEDALYTIPAAPGSSGSGIFNSRGELVGIIHSAIQGFQSVSISITQDNLEIFVLELTSDYGLVHH